MSDLDYHNLSLAELAELSQAAPGERPKHPAAAAAVAVTAAANLRVRPPAPKRYSGPDEPTKVARELRAEVFLTDDCEPSLIRWRESWWRWEQDRSIWVEASQEVIDGLIQEALQGAVHFSRQSVFAVQWKPTPARIANVRNALRQVARIPDDVQFGGLIDPDTAAVGVPEQRVIPVLGGYLYKGEDGQRHWGVPDPNRFTVSTLAVRYDPDFASGPDRAIWQSYLNEILDEQGQLLLQEVFGYLISGRTDLQVWLQLIGLPRSGKGTVTRLLGSLFGQSYGTTDICSLGEKFGLEDLIGKSVVVLGDVRVRGSQRAVERLLGITGEDAQRVDRKCVTAFAGVQMPCRFIAAGNAPAVFPDDSGALDARSLFLRTQGSFIDRVDPEVEALLHEPEVLQAILIWALEGLDRLDAASGKGRLRFTVQDAAGADRKAAKLLGSPIKQFIEQHYVGMEGARVDLIEFNDAYNAWLKDNRFPTQPKLQTQTELQSAGYRVTKPKDAQRRTLPYAVQDLLAV